MFNCFLFRNSKPLLTGIFLGVIGMLGTSAHATTIFSCKTDTSETQFKGKLYSSLSALGLNGRFITIEATNPERTNWAVGGSTLDKNTLKIQDLPYFQVKPEKVILPADTGLRLVETVSKKEIALAHFAPGRIVEFSGQDDCGVSQFMESIELRQNIVAWAQTLQWGWPEGGPAKWNNKFWDRGTPLSKDLTKKALEDALLHQDKYEIGCYTATKLVYAHAYLDYYGRIKQDKTAFTKILNSLWENEDPLVSIEPEKFWNFEPGHQIPEKYTNGKLMTISQPAAETHFIPGDWVYYLNTDAVSYQKTGYEGSNSIYLGRNRFDDYYNDNEGYYSFEEKLDEILQWKNGVFSRSHHANKIQPMSLSQLYSYAKSPSEGGFLINVRLVPKTLNEIGLKTP